MAYTPNTWASGDTITATKLNNIEQGIANTGYDLVFEYDVVENTCLLISGDILDAEDKIDDGETVTGVCYVKSSWSVIPSGANTNKILIILPLTYFEPPYTILRFGCVYYAGNYESVCINIVYDPDTGEIDSFNYSSGQI